MFDGRHTHVALSENRTTLGVDDLLCDSFDSRLPFEVGALNAVACVLGCGVEGNGEVKTCVQSLARQRETAFQGLLLH